MTLTNDDLMAISQLFDVKMELALKPVKDEICILHSEIHTLKDEVYTLKDEVHTLKDEVYTLKDEVYTLKDEVHTLKDEVYTLKDNFHALKLHIENVTDKNIAILAENYVPVAIRYEKAVPKIEAMEADIDIIKKVITDHSQKLRALA